MPTSALGATATIAPEASRSTMSRRRKRRAALFVAFELRAADLDAVAAAEILLDRGGQPGRRQVEHDRAAGRAATTAPPPPISTTTTTAISAERQLAHHRMAAVERKPGVERQPPAGLRRIPQARRPGSALVGIAQARGRAGSAWVRRCASSAASSSWSAAMRGLLSLSVMPDRPSPRPPV